MDGDAQSLADKDLELIEERNVSLAYAAEHEKLNLEITTTRSHNDKMASDLRLLKEQWEEVGERNRNDDDHGNGDDSLIPGRSLSTLSRSATSSACNTCSSRRKRWAWRMSATRSSTSWRRCDSRKGRKTPSGR